MENLKVPVATVGVKETSEFARLLTSISLMFVEYWGRRANIATIAGGLVTRLLLITEGVQGVNQIGIELKDLTDAEELQVRSVIRAEIQREFGDREDTEEIVGLIYQTVLSVSSTILKVAEATKRA